MVERSIFDKRVNIEPEEYPKISMYKDAIRASYWVHTEYNVNPDVQHFFLLPEEQKEIMKRAMLAIAQIEVQVKRFWTDIYKVFPKPEIDGVGVTFADSEERHKDAYKFLLDVMNLKKEFEKIKDIPAIQDRIEYLDKVSEAMLNYAITGDKKKVVFSVIIFSLFIEHISLFGQFFIMLSFNKHDATFKGIANIVQATSKEEQIHGLFGLELYRIIKEENPELIDDEIKEDLEKLCKKAQLAEEKVLDWIFEHGDTPFLKKANVLNYINSRFNLALSELDLEYRVPVDETALKETRWFDELLLASSDFDFFNKRSTDYTKKTSSITAEDLFD